jgi:hypothetical protein
LGQNNGPAAVGRLLSVAGALLAAEFDCGDVAPTVLQCFGGGYELAYFNNVEFKKLPQLTFVFWDATLDNNGVGLAMPKFILKQQYLGDVLLLRSARIVVKRNQPSALVDEQRKVILPPYPASTRVAREELLRVTFQSNVLCHCVSVNDRGKFTYFSRIDIHGSTAPSLLFSDTAAGVELTVARTLIDELSKSRPALLGARLEHDRAKREQWTFVSRTTMFPSYRSRRTRREQRAANLDPQSDCSHRPSLRAAHT